MIKNGTWIRLIRDDRNCTVLHCTTQCITLQCSVQYIALQFDTLFSYNAQNFLVTQGTMYYSAIQCNTVQCNVALYLNNMKL